MSLLTLGVTGNTDRLSTSLLLDIHSGAAVGFGLNKLRSSYTGPCIRIRRSSDNQELDIGFIGEDLDTAAISSFCGLSNGFVRTWYDQSGNNNHLFQTIISNQPVIYWSGAVVTRNSKPAINFNDLSGQINDHFNLLVGITSANDWSMFHVTQRLASGQPGIMGLADVTYGAWVFGDNILYARNQEKVESVSFNVTDLQLLTTIAKTNNISVRNDGAHVNTSLLVHLTTTTNFSYYNRRNSDYGRGWGQLLVHYSDDRGASASAIETIINDYYGAF